MNKVIFGLAAALLTASPVFADVHVTMQDGRVSIVARDATVRQILTEWARVGQTKIVNVERVPGGPVTIELKSVTETQALEVLLRSLSGYILAPRAVAAANMSTFDRIIIMPTLAAARQTASASSAPPPPGVPQVPQPQIPQPQLQPPVEDEQPQAARDPDDDVPAARVAMPAQPNGVPVLNPFPAHSQEVAPQGVLPGGTAVATPTAVQTPAASPRSPSAPPGGVPVPGMVVPAPQQPKQNQPSGAPGQPARRPGGP